MIKFHRSLLITLTLYAATQWATAQEIVVSPQPGNTGLLARIRAAKSIYKDDATQELQLRRSKLAQAVSELRLLLANSGSTYETGWKQYLHFEQLENSLSETTPTEAPQLREIVERLSRDQNGLEMRQFRGVRERLREYLAAVESQRQARSVEVYHTRLEDLALRVERAHDPAKNDNSEIARHIAWLDSLGLDNDLVNQVRYEYDNPNLQLEVSQAFLANQATRPVDQVSPVRDNILGTSIFGTARMVGQTSVSTNPSWSNGSLLLHLTGHAYSNSVGYNGPATIFTTGTTSIHATKPIILTADGVQLLPASANCSTSTQINDIQTKRRIVNRIAWKKAGKQKSQAEAIASQHAEARIAKQLDEEVATQLATANGRYESEVRNPLERRGLWPTSTHVATSGNSLHIQALSMEAGQIAASSATPATLATASPVMVKAHESYIANAAARMIGGMELTDEKLVQLLQENKREVPEELKITDESDPWSITFANDYPVTVSFDDNRLSITVRAQRFTKGKNDEGQPEQEVKALVDIAAAYQLYQLPTGVLLVREGDVTVDLVGQKKLSAAQVATKTFLKRKFSSLFKQEYRGEGFELPSQMTGNRKMVVQQILTHNGWLVAGLSN
jgi:hypothetical protein